MIARRLDPKMWREIAGASVQIPTVNSTVYYFPQGHLDEASSPPQNLSPLLLSRPYILCTVSAIQFLADLNNDEAFAYLVLQPLVSVAGLPRRVPNPAVAADGNNDHRFVSFAKILTLSDAKNGGGFTVPRSCAESIFPALNLLADPPVQVLRFADVHGKAWEFRHFYACTTKQHILTTGWSKFVDKKKLVAGDSVVFMKNSAGKMFIGIRRAARFTSENAKWKLSPESVAKAAESAARNMPFEVVYYPNPKAGWSDFVVKAEVVEKALNAVWGPGMRVKMAAESDDSCRITWFQGIVSSLIINGSGPWQGSPWRILQIKWDEPEVLKNSKWVSPWQVELITPALRTEGIGNPLDDSFTDMKLLDRLDAQCQSASTVEEFYLGK